MSENKVFVVMANGGGYDHQWESPVEAHTNLEVAEQRVKDLNAQSVKNVAAAEEVRSSFVDYSKTTPRPPYANTIHPPRRSKEERVLMGQQKYQEELQAVVAHNAEETRKWTEASNAWFAGHYPTYVAIMNKHGALPVVSIDDRSMWGAVQGVVDSEGVLYGLEEIPLIYG